MKRILLVLMAAFSLLSACDKYDDSQIKDALGKLEDRVAALETLNADVAALKVIVQNQVTVVSCVERDGRQTVTLSDGKEIIITPALSTIPVVTIIEYAGKKCWAYYFEDEIVPFKINGTPVAVTGVVPDIRVSDDGTLEVSVDGGKNWVKTSAQMSSGLFSGAEVQDDNVVFTLSDGYTSFSVPLMKESELQFEAFSGKQYFEYGQNKSVVIGMVGIDKFTITEKPEGWKVRLTDGNLDITAPAEGIGETEGYIKMIGIGSEPKITQVYVTIGTSPCQLSIASNLDVTIEPNSVITFYGACLIADFDPKSIVKNLSSVTNPMLSRDPYTDFKLVVPLSNMLDVVYGETYVVWALPMAGGTYDETDVLFEAVSSIGVGHEVSDITFDNAKISVEVKGADSFYLVPLGSDMTLDNCMEDLNGSFASSYDRYKYVSSFKGYLSELEESPLAATEYRFAIIPVRFGTPLQGDAKTFSLTLKPYTRGGSAGVTIEEKSKDLKSIAVTVSATNAHKTFVAIVSESDYQTMNYADDTALLDYLSTLVGEKYSAPYTYVAKNLESGSSYYVLAAAIDATGVFGSPIRKKVSTKSIEYTDAVITIGEVEGSLSSVTIPLSANGEIVKYRYIFLAGDGSDYWYYTYVDDDQLTENALIYGTADYIEVFASDVASGLTFNELEFGATYIFRVVGYDKDGKVTHLAKADVTPTVGKVVQYSDARWAAAKPAVSAIKSGTSMKLTVAFPSACTQYVVARVSSEEYAARYPGSGRQRTDFVLSHGSAITFDADITNYNPGWYVSADMPYIIIAWQDENGWYEPIVIDSSNGTMLNK